MAAQNGIADDVENPAEELSLREEIESARDAYVAETIVEGDEGKGEQAAAGGRQRDEHGRFLKGGDASQTDPAQAQPVAADPAQQPAGQAAPSPGAQAPGAQAPEAAPGSPAIAPNSWSAAAKAQWATLAPEIRSEIARRETEIHKTLGRHDEERQLGNQLGQIYQSNLEFFQRAQVHPLKLMNDYIGISKILGGSDIEAKAQLLFHAARQNGIDLNALARMQGGAPSGQQQQGQPSPSPQPAQVIVPPELQAMQREWSTFKQEQEREKQASEERANQEAYDEIVAFRAKPESRFFDAVQPTMVQMMQSGQTASLQEAYDAACWARPDIRAILINEANATKVAQETKANRVHRAREKAVSVTGGAGGTGGNAQVPDRSLREELKANLAAASAQRM